MSSYVGLAFNPKSKKIEEATFLDDFFGRHVYGVRFKDGWTYTENEVFRGYNKSKTKLERVK